MATNENLIPIPGRLHSVATEGHVAGADEIYDDALGKPQSEVNASKADLVNGKVPSEQLPSYVDDVVNGYYYNGSFYKEAAHATVITGEEDKIYVDIPTDKSYRWSGSAYILISNPYSVDEEDLTVVNNNIKFKDRPNTDGMGRVILRKNMVSGVNTLTQDMMPVATGGNTIYVIQYDFTLGEDITVPANCVLEFDGGSLRNGTLVFEDNVIISSTDRKIFYNILFSGDCTKQYFNIDWFVANYTDTITNDAPDATAEIQSMFNCGIKKVWLTNKHSYRLTQTVEVDARIEINGTSQSRGGIYCNYIFGSFDAPLIKIKAAANTETWMSIARNIYLYRIMDASLITNVNNYKRDISTIYVDCSEGKIWGFDFYGVLMHNDVRLTFYTANNTPKYTWTGGYTGIEIYAANGNYISYITIDGAIHDYYRGIYVHKDNGNGTWITQTTIKCDTEGVYGGTIESGTHLFGAHQCRHAFPVNNREAYFDIKNVCDVVDGFIWDASMGDVSNTDRIVNCWYTIRCFRLEGNGSLNYGVDCLNARNNKGLTYIGNGAGNTLMLANLLPDVFYNMPNRKSSRISNIIYKVFSTDADYESFVAGDTSKGTLITKDNTANFEDLFFPDKLAYDTGVQYGETEAKKDRGTYVIDVNVKYVYLSCTISELSRLAIIVNYLSGDINSVFIDNGDGELKEYKDSNIGQLVNVYNPIYKELIGNYAIKTIRVILKYSGSAKRYLPFIGICGVGAGNMIGPWGGSVYGDLVTNNIYNKLIDSEHIDTKEIEVKNTVINRYSASSAFNKLFGTGDSTYVNILHYRNKIGDNVHTDIKLKDDYGTYTISRASAGGFRLFGNSTVDIVLKNYRKYITISGVAYEDIVIAVKGIKGLVIEEVIGTDDIEIFDDVETVDLTNYSENWYDVLYTHSLSISGIYNYRPINIQRGYMYFCTDKPQAPGSPIFYAGNNTWVYADGTTVS